MSNNKLSIIGTSQGGRIDKIRRLLESLLNFNQPYELIFVDQSLGEEISELFEEYNKKIHYKLIVSSRVSLSKARNIAIASCSGNIVCFCDDDAFYEQELLYYLMSQSITAPVVFTVPVKDYSSGEHYGNRSFPLCDASFNYLSAIKYCLSVSVFIYGSTNEWIKENVFFDENLGVGAPIGGSEETDLMLSLLGKKVCINYLSSFVVYHDNDYSESDDLEVLKKKYRNYARGYSYVVKKHMVSSRFILLFELMNITLRSLIGVMISKNRILYFNRLVGLFEGFKSVLNVR
jgi:glycosyltransferase involved in cell wall biosynthesis